MSKQKNKLHGRSAVYNNVEQIFRDNPSKVFTTTNIIKRLRSRANKGERIEIAKALKDMIAKGVLVQVRSGEFKFNSANLKHYQASIATITPTVSFATCSDFEDDIIIEKYDLANALVGDKVEVVVFESRRNGRFKGIVQNIIERSNRRYVGIIEVKESFAFVSTTSRDMQYDIFIPIRDTANASSGDMVVAEIVEFKSSQPNPVGKVLKNLGKAGSNSAEIHSILEEYSLPYEFNPAVIEESEKIPFEIPKSEIERRRDMRQTTTITIDPFDAKDFDDAISIKTIDENSFEIGIHIADVSHYISEDSLLEQDAKLRATSVYLVDRVVPMLPERLSNGVCSLRPNEEKLCFSVVLKMNREAQILDRWIGRTVINSDKRFTYEDAQAIIEGGEGDFKDEVLQLHQIALKLREKRFEGGSLAFDREEFKFKLDEDARPIGVYTKVQKESNHLVEEFMLLANKSVAEYIALSKQPRRTFVYRVHAEPNSEKYNELCKFVGKFGYSIQPSSDHRVISRELNNLLSKVKGEKTETLISTLALRSMAKASYTTMNIGHYGLGFPNYTHFTSPIRRYPDVMVHRLLQRYLDGEPSASQEYYEDLCDHSSKQEIRASEAERASIKYKMAEFMADKIGEQFSGRISGVTERGIYVELADTHIEGMVSINDLTDDYYTFDAENYQMVGRNNRERLLLGDEVTIEVLRVDMSRKLIDFSMISHKDLQTGIIYNFR